MNDIRVLVPLTLNYSRLVAACEYQCAYVVRPDIQRRVWRALLLSRNKVVLVGAGEASRDNLCGMEGSSKQSEVTVLCVCVCVCVRVSVCVGVCVCVCLCVCV